MRVRWSLHAIADLQQIADYIRADSPRAAHEFVVRVMSGVRLLRDHPRRGRTIPEAQHEDHREILIGNYRVMYHVGAARVLVTGVIHGARNPELLPRKPWDVS